MPIIFTVLYNELYLYSSNFEGYILYGINKYILTVLNFTIWTHETKHILEPYILKPYKSCINLTRGSYTNTRPLPQVGPIGEPGYI